MSLPHRIAKEKFAPSSQTETIELNGLWNACSTIGKDLSQPIKSCLTWAPIRAYLSLWTVAASSLPPRVLLLFKADSIARAQSAAQAVSGRPADTVARDEDFWFNVRHAFTVDRNMINLNNGGVSPVAQDRDGHRDPLSRNGEHEPVLLHVERARSGHRDRAPAPGARPSAAIRKKSRSRATPAKRSKSFSLAWI